MAITGIAVQRGLMPGNQGAALVGGGILTTILFPAIARRFLREQPPAPARLGIDRGGEQCRPCQMGPADVARSGLSLRSPPLEQGVEGAVGDACERYQALDGNREPRDHRRGQRSEPDTSISGTVHQELRRPSLRLRRPIRPLSVLGVDPLETWTWGLSLVALTIVIHAAALASMRLAVYSIRVRVKSISLGLRDLFDLCRPDRSDRTTSGPATRV